MQPVSPGNLALFAVDVKKLNAEKPVACRQHRSRQFSSSQVMNIDSGPSVHFIDPTEAFFDGSFRSKLTTNEGRFLYYGESHLTMTGVRVLEPYLKRQLANILDTE